MQNKKLCFREIKAKNIAPALNFAVLKISFVQDEKPRCKIWYDIAWTIPLFSLNVSKRSQFRPWKPLYISGVSRTFLMDVLMKRYLIKFFTKWNNTFFCIEDFFVRRKTYCSALIIEIYRVEELDRHIFPEYSLRASNIWIKYDKEDSRI